MTTQLEIAQMALAEIGTRSTIASLTEDSVEALYCNLYYAAVRDQALRAARWNFAGRTDNLELWKAAPGTPDNSTAAAGWDRSQPAPPWLYSYLTPPDCLYVRYILAQPNIATAMPTPIFPVSGATISVPRSVKAPFEVATDAYDLSGETFIVPHKIILTNQQAPLLCYTYSDPHEELWDSEFVMVIVLAMAARLAVALTGDKAMAQMKLQAANGMIQEARARDGNEGVTIMDHIPDWLSCRGAGTMSSTLQYDFMYPYGPMFTMSAYV